MKAGLQVMKNPQFILLKQEIKVFKVCVLFCYLKKHFSLSKIRQNKVFDYLLCGYYGLKCL